MVGPQLVCYQPPPGAGPSLSAAASPRLGPGRVIKRPPWPGPSLPSSLIWPGWQVGTSDKDWGSPGFWGLQLHAPSPWLGQEYGMGVGRVRSVPAPPLQGLPGSLSWGDRWGRGCWGLTPTPGSCWEQSVLGRPGPLLVAPHRQEGLDATCYRQGQGRPCLGVLVGWWQQGQMNAQPQQGSWGQR